MQDGLVTIGYFARLCRLSFKRRAYLVGPAEAPQEELMTRLIIPVQESVA